MRRKEEKRREEKRREERKKRRRSLKVKKNQVAPKIEMMMSPTMVRKMTRSQARQRTTPMEPYPLTILLCLTLTLEFSSVYPRVNYQILMGLIFSCGST